jgi:small subunit ribosomal protein S3
MAQVEKSAVKSLLAMRRTYSDLDEYLESQLREAGYAGVDIQRNPVGTRITVFVTRPGLAIGRRGIGIKELTERVAQRFNLPNPQIAVSEVERPELNPRIMAQRTAQIVQRGTAFRRAANWTMTTIMEAGAMGVEIGVAGKLRSDRAHKEKYRMGVVPKSGETADEIVRSATTDVLMKLGLFGIKVKIAIPDAIPPAVEFFDGKQEGEQAAPAAAAPQAPAPQAQPAPAASQVTQAPAAPAPAPSASVEKPAAAAAAPEAPAAEAKAKPKAKAKRKTASAGTKKRTTAKKKAAEKTQDEEETKDAKSEG